MVSLNNPFYVNRGPYTQRKVTLLREVNSRERYYSLHISTTLFGEYLLIKENGSVKNKKPTRIVKEYYKKEYEVLLRYMTIIREKIKKGYHYKISDNHPFTRRFRNVQSRKSTI